MSYFMETLLQKDEVSRRERLMQPMPMYNNMTFHMFANVLINHYIRILPVCEIHFVNNDDCYCR